MILTCFDHFVYLFLHIFYYQDEILYIARELNETVHRYKIRFFIEYPFTLLRKTICVYKMLFNGMIYQKWPRIPHLTSGMGWRGTNRPSFLLR